MFEDEEIYGESIEFYDIASSIQPNIDKKVIEKFTKLSNMNNGIILDIGAGTGKNTVEIAKQNPYKKIVALEPSLYMRIAMMTRVIENRDICKNITILPQSIDQYKFEENISGILCIGVLGHLQNNLIEKMWLNFEKKLRPNTPVLLGLLDNRYLEISTPKMLSFAYQGNLRYETHLIEKNNLHNKWEWIIQYKVYDKEVLIKEIKCPMSWNYQGPEKVLSKLIAIGFRVIKLSNTLLIAIKNR